MATWVENLHPRVPRGQPGGGRFAEKGGAGGWALDESDHVEVAKYSVNSRTLRDGIDKAPSPIERDALENYSMYSMQVNNMLRTTGKPRDEYERDLVNGLDSLLTKGRLSEDVVLYRAYSLTGKVPQILDGLKPGDTLLDRGYISTAQNLLAAQYSIGTKQAGAMKILAPAGSKAICVSDKLPDFGAQREVLLDRNSRLEYMGEDRDGAHVFKLQQGASGKKPIEPRVRLTEEKHPGHGYSAEARVDAKGVIHTGNVYDAVRALYEQKEVELTQPRQVSVLVDKLGAIASRMAKLGEKAPNFDLCKVTVKGTNLFCADAKGFPRVAMPQLKGVPEPGSKAAKMYADVRGEVDVTNDFRKYLQEQGYTTTESRTPAAYLKPTQGELNGPKVAWIADYLRHGKLAAQALFTSKDDYIIDGHHRWAAMLAVDFDDNKIGNIHVPVTKVNAPIVTLLAEARKFTKMIGIPQVSIKGFVEEKKKVKRVTANKEPWL